MSCKFCLKEATTHVLNRYGMRVACCAYCRCAAVIRGTHKLEGEALVVV